MIVAFWGESVKGEGVRNKARNRYCFFVEIVRSRKAQCTSRKAGSSPTNEGDSIAEAPMCAFQIARFTQVGLQPAIVGGKYAAVSLLPMAINITAQASPVNAESTPFYGLNVTNWSAGTAALEIFPSAVVHEMLTFSFESDCSLNPVIGIWLEANLMNGVM